MDAAELDLFDRTLRGATEAHSGADLDAALVELGWHDALADDRHAAVSLLFEHQGRTAVTSGALDDVIADALGTDTAPDSAIVFPALGRAEPPAHQVAGGVVLEGLGTSRLLRRDTAWVVVSTPQGIVAAAVKTAELACRPVLGMDPDFGLVEVAGGATVVAPVTPIDPNGWSTAVSGARLAVGHELVGASAAMLELARVHALNRVQFGSPISAFQAVRHRLADSLVAVESARALLDAAWQDGSGETAAMAKALSGRSARTVARHCQQVLAGIGFTTEHPLHRYIRRVLVLDELFGSARSLTAALGRDVLTRRRLPPPLPL
ncbi:MAG TPA: acyl-CoA dehydrogenase family protein [Acidimicrobiales bacterium]|nr:acyl-CoA dehydrogenase family protein [Acidimicrobiales bacterium]